MKVKISDLEKSVIGRKHRVGGCSVQQTQKVFFMIAFGDEYDWDRVEFVKAEFERDVIVIKW